MRNSATESETERGHSCPQVPPRSPAPAWEHTFPVPVRALGVAPRAINEIVLGKRPITPISNRFGAFFGQSEGSWHGLQVECDFRALARKRRQLVAGIRPAKELAHT